MTNQLHTAPTALITALSLVLFGCGGNKTETSTDAGEPPKIELITNENIIADGDLAEVQEITLNNGTDPTSLDPHIVSGVPEGNIIRQMLVGLTNTDNDGNTIPGMAESWDSPDNKVWTFKLRDANWSNGDPVTADDFVFSFRRLVDPQTASPYASYLDDARIVNAQDVIDGKKPLDALGIRAIDAKTLEITLSEPVPYFPDMLIHTSVKPVNPRALKEFGDNWINADNYVVNGPYKLKEWIVNERITLVRNPSYYDDANTIIDKATILAVPAPETELARYQSGELDVSSFPTEQFQQVKQKFGAELVVRPALCTYYYEFNHQKAPFDDERVRRALALATDREIIAEKVLGTGQQPAYQFTPTTTQGNKPYEPEWKAWDNEKRIAEAKKLLAEAGYSESNPLKFELLYNTSEGHKKIALAATSFWKERLGFVDVELVNQEWKVFLESRHKQEFQLARAAWCADYNESSTFLNIFKTNNSNNTGKYSSSAFDKLLASTLGGDVTNEQRADFYQQAEAQMDKDTAAIWVYQYVSPVLIKPYVGGYTVKDPLSNWQIKNMRIGKH